LFAEGNFDWMRPVRTTGLCGSLLLLPLGCGENDGGPLGVDVPTDPGLVLQPNELCSDHSDRHIATFEDATLEAAIIGALGIGVQEDLTCGLVSEVAVLVGPEGHLMDQKVESLEGVQNLTGLTSLTLWDHSVRDLSALSGLTSLTHLDLWVNSISDISKLSGLTSLMVLTLYDNSISDISALSELTDLGDVEGAFFRPHPDLNLSNNPNLTTIQPLLDNTGLGAGDTVDLSDVNPTMPCADVALLQAKGVTVIFNVCT
jgi:hypothetical protein